MGHGAAREEVKKAGEGDISVKHSSIDTHLGCSHGLSFLLNNIKLPFICN